MPVLAGWITGEQVPQDVIEQTLTAMGGVLEQHGGSPARTIYPGAGLIAFSDTAYAMQQNDDPPVLDWVPERRTLVYRRPLSGIHPLYYIADWPSTGNLLFASEMKALFSVGVPRRLHLAALDALLRYGFIPASWTLFKDIQSVPAGSILRWQHAKTVLNHAIDFHIDEPLKATPTLASIHSLLDTACAAMLPPHDQIAALTDFRDDASALAAILTSQHTNAPFRLATLNSTQSKQRDLWNSLEEVAQACDRTALLIKPVDQLDFWTATLVNTETPALHPRPLLLHQLLHTVADQTQARVLISGSGANSAFGPLSHTQSITTTPTKEDPLASYRQLLLGPSVHIPHTLWSPDVANALQTQEPWEETLHARKLARRASQFSTQQQLLHYLDLHLRLPDYLVNTMQQLAISEHLIERSPYLNIKTLETLVRLPAILQDGTPEETILAQLLQKYIPARTAYPPTSTHLIAQADIPFSKTRDALFKRMLAPQKITDTGLFNPQAVQALLQRKSSSTIPRELLLIFTTQLFCQMFEVEVL